MELTQSEKTLLGALIGLARAADGRADAQEAAFAAIADGLRAIAQHDAAALAPLTERARNEKFALAPDCAVCAAPCGRTAEFDAAAWQTEPEPQRALHRAIFSRALALARSAAPDTRLLARAVFALGEDWDPQWLRPVLEELEAAKAR